VFYGGFKGKGLKEKYRGRGLLNIRKSLLFFAVQGSYPGYYR